ncbi:hypothetical protein [Phaffia rhodozyma]|uniref:Uncharacterized protein n=1 Tax=Phaffia rhodozyma TaxID=264483 RepID=A0A0F7SQJ9_PHARH|nr:hypothetical protein [Phaffia rhodozyma]
MVFKAPFPLSTFKPLSRTSSPAPTNSRASPELPPSPPRGRPSLDGPENNEKRSRSVTRPRHILSLSRSATPISTPSPSPQMSSTPLPAGSAPLVNGSTESVCHIETVGERLSEAVTKALAGSLTAGEFKGRRGLARGSGRDVATMVIKEFPAPPVDVYYLRAIVRVSVKHLSVLASRIETLLLPAIVDPTFAHPILSTPLPPPSIRLNSVSPILASPFNACQTYCLSLAHAAFEVRDTLSSFLHAEPGENKPRFVGDSLKPILEKLDFIMGKVMQPLLARLKKELADTVQGLKTVSICASGKPTKAAAPAEPPIPSSLTPFASKVEHAHRCLAKISANCGDIGEGWVVGVVASTVWRGMVGIVERPCPPGEKSSPKGTNQRMSPVSTPSALGSTMAQPKPKPTNSVKSSTIVATLLRPPGSRPPSPSRPVVTDPSTILVSSFEVLVRKLVDGLVPYVLPASSDPGHLAREALAEALEALQSLKIVLAALGKPGGLDFLLTGLEVLKTSSQTAAGQVEQDDSFLDALDDVPPVLLFHLWGARLSSLSGAEEQQHRPMLVGSPHTLFGWSRDQYDRTVLAGFGSAEEWERKVGAAVKAEVAGVLAKQSGSMTEEERKYLRAMSLTVDVI